MIVERYLEWAASAPSHLRAEAAGALARSYLHGGLEQPVRRDLGEALLRCLDDPAYEVRLVIARTFAPSANAPHAIILALAQDIAEISLPVLALSPVLADFELVDLAALGGAGAQCAIAGRARVSAPVAAALGEIGSASACEALMRNSGATLTLFTVQRIAERHGGDAGVRNALLARDDLTPELRQTVMRAFATSLSSFVAERGWLGADRACRAADDACDRGAIVIAADADDARDFVLHLANRGEFSPSLALRALLSGRQSLFEASLSALSEQEPKRVAGFVRAFEGRGFEALYRDAGFPASALPVFRAALSAAREVGFVDDENGRAELSRRMVERALTACEGTDLEAQPLFALLRRFSAEAAREEARRAIPAPPFSQAA
jgi:uncharacterized protein (DUF2336 family)